jgi:hypothetical protein
MSYKLELTSGAHLDLRKRYEKKYAEVSDAKERFILRGKYDEELQELRQKCTENFHEYINKESALTPESKQKNAVCVCDICNKRVHPTKQNELR